MNHLKSLLVVLLTIFYFKSFSQTLATPGVNSQLYVGESDKQTLIVGLGGSEGGNPWASNYWKPTRDEFIKKGYAFLALGYFGAKGAPDTLDRISLEKVHDAIIEAAKNPKIDKDKIAVIGGSKGGELALLLASHFKDITCVIAIVPSHVAFPGLTSHLSTSSWTYQDKEVPYVPVSEETIPALIKRDLRLAFDTMLKDTVAVEKALIKVENINGPVLLMSATKDEMWGSTPMSEAIVARLQAKQSSHYYEHIVIEGGHTEPLKHFDKIFEFLMKHFQNE
ncbi:acyl-CoA thioester hydrolase/BAAT C-terminal domain-containing protein [Emticicia sp. C21]|uniref:acyl-CoA thioester hydrolase/BAAT C-terminal domain-containing protein n=1 Tax=Emticicia sp. C21 TaxID=2302915 RepID=UPI000E35711E|nr:acyl-CoA thioester hydrolase/BAAT C-terminal domain-containing protein [Emticicia sp. C21]RFS15202.1 alpha/beta hydrolase [Emticicia sp. C21]